VTRRPKQEKVMSIIIVVSTRQEPAPRAMSGEEYPRTIAGLLKAAESLGECTRLVRTHTDSAARLWIEVDGRQVDADSILFCANAEYARKEAARILKAAMTPQ
jgi:hypothetical protein